MPETLLILLIALLLIVIILQIVFRPKADNNLPLLQEKLVRLEGGSARLEQLVREELRISREETAGLVRDNRTELGDTLRADARQGRESIEKAFDGFRQSFNEAMGAFKDLQREKFGQLEEKQNALIKQTEEKLEKMRETVDEKLTKTLSERLGQSFEQVSKHLESVQQGLGEMKTLATDVGGLKKVLSNVKLRGGMGEVQLAMLLEQILSPSQYDVNVKTKAGGNEPVEFAIKLPGRSEDEGAHVYLPIERQVYRSAAYDGFRAALPAL